MKLKYILYSFCTLYSAYVHCQAGISCQEPIKISCNKSFHFDQFYHHTAEMKDCMPCATGFKSVNDIWLELDISKSGNLEFEIIADVAGHDIDFAIYDADLGCGQKQALRCNASAPLTIEAGTGLDDNSKDVFEKEGKSKGQDGWLSKLLVSKNQRLLIYLHNFNGIQGATIHFQNALSTPSAEHNYVLQEIPGNYDEVSYSLKADVQPESVQWVFREAKEVVSKEGSGPHILNGKEITGYSVLVNASKTCGLELLRESTTEKLSDNLSIYPNPARDLTFIDLSNVEIRKINKIQCFQQGKLLRDVPNASIREANYQLDTRSFPKGMIDIVVVKEDGSYINGRFINN